MNIVNNGPWSVSVFITVKKKGNPVNSSSFYPQRCDAHICKPQPFITTDDKLHPLMKADSGSLPTPPRIKHTFLWHNELYWCSSQAFLWNYLLFAGLRSVKTYFKALNSSHGVARTIQILKKALPRLHNQLCKPCCQTADLSVCLWMNWRSTSCIFCTSYWNLCVVFCGRGRESFMGRFGFF